MKDVSQNSKMVVSKINLPDDYLSMSAPESPIYVIQNKGFSDPPKGFGGMDCQNPWMKTTKEQGRHWA